MRFSVIAMSKHEAQCKEGIMVGVLWTSRKFNSINMCMSKRTVRRGGGDVRIDVTAEERSIHSPHSRSFLEIECTGSNQ